MYCINCGVKLEDSQKQCPLCGVKVYHPDLQLPKGEPLYPNHRYPAPEVASRAAQIVLTTLMTIAALITSFVDYQINGSITWGGIAAGGILVAYVVFVTPFWTRKVNPLVYIPGVFGTIVVYLWYLAYTVGGVWFWSFALPATAYLGTLVTLESWLLVRWRSRALTILGGGMIALGAFVVLLEYLIYITFSVRKFVAWSVYPFISLLLLGVMLIFLAINRSAREKMERKFFI